jgi:hypothetical protein
MAAIGTDFEAVTAVDAKLFIEGNLWMEANGLRIVAPEAVQRTSLEEDRCAYARAVLN